MFSKELENLIQATLEDGVLEEYEKAALVKRASAEGVDLTELEIYINSILQKRKRELDNKKNAEYAALDKQKKQDFGKTCPACGRQVPSLALNCECGYEFKNDKRESSVELLSNKISKIQDKHNGKEDDDRKEINRLIIDTITMFPVPNTKEDIMDFLALAAPNSKKKGGMWGTIPGRIKILSCIAVIGFVLCIIFGGVEVEKGPTAGLILVLCVAFYGGMACFSIDQDSILYNKRADAWRAKFDQVLMKGRSLRADAEFTQMLDYYEQQVNKK